MATKQFRSGAQGKFFVGSEVLIITGDGAVFSGLIEATGGKEGEGRLLAVRLNLLPTERMERHPEKQESEAERLLGEIKRNGA